MSNQPLVQVFLMSYNRPEYIEEALRSVFAQDYPHFEVILSDNSTSDQVFDLVRSRFSNELLLNLENIEATTVQPNLKKKRSLSIRRRRPSLSVLDHHNQIISEVTAPYFMMFHDDDVLQPTALTQMMNTFATDNQLAAVGCNAWIIEGTKLTQQRFDENLQNSFNIESPAQVASHYLRPEMGHVPFPSYIYKTSALTNLQMKWCEGNKHADVSFIIKIGQRGKICWLAEPLMSYRRHSSNGSVAIDLRAILSLARFLRKTFFLPKSRPNPKSDNCGLARLVEIYVFKHKILWWKQTIKEKELGSGPKSKLSPTQSRILRKSTLRDIFREIPLLLVLLSRKYASRTGLLSKGILK